MSMILFSSVPDKPRPSDALVEEIKSEYRRIDDNWLRLHFRVFAGLVIFALIVECIMAEVLMNTEVVTTTELRYILKFIIAPSGINFLLLLAGFLITRSKSFTQTFKIYTVSMIFVLTSTVLFTAHSAFVASYLFFIFSIMLTTIYVDPLLTTLTSLSSITLMSVSELFIVWDLDKPSVFTSSQRLGEFLIAVFILLAVFAVSLVEIRFSKKKNDASIQKELDRLMLKQKLEIDELTGVFSRKALHDAMRDLALRKSENTYIFAIADIDHFKTINDQYGHQAGDAYLVSFSSILKNLSTACSVFRYGGDEFCLLFKGLSMKQAIDFCRETQNRLKKLVIDGYPEIKRTASFGLANFSDRMTTAELFMNADQALYTAKEKRNDIHVY